MAYSVNATFDGEARKIEGTTPITLYVINASQTGTDYQYYAGYNQDVYGYQLDSDGNLATTEQLYTALPMQRDNLETNTEGKISEVNISVPNVDRAIESVIQSQDYLRGRDVYVITAFAKNLPSGATAYHVGSEDDYNAAIKEKYYVDSVTSNEEAVTFTCKPKFVIKNVVLPRRKYRRECAWALMGKYLGTECSPLDVTSTFTASYPTCDGSLEQCRERKNSARFGGFVSIPKNFISVV